VIHIENASDKHFENFESLGIYYSLPFLFSIFAYDAIFIPIKHFILQKFQVKIVTSMVFKSAKFGDFSKISKFTIFSLSFDG